MFPDLIDLGVRDLPWLGETHVVLPTYGVVFAAAVVAAWLWFTRRARAVGVPEQTVFDLMFFTLLAGILGAKLLLVLVELPLYLREPGQLVGVLRSGGVLLGGVVAGALTFVAVCRRRKLPTLRLLDAMAAPLVLAQGIGRLACFGAGCCWGAAAPADHPLAVEYTSAVATSRTGVPLHTPVWPVQLFELTIDLGLAAFLTWLWRRRPEPGGQVWWTYLLAYGVARFGLEALRGDVHRGVWLGGALSTSQALSLAAVALAAAMLVRGARARRRAAAA